MAIPSRKELLSKYEFAIPYFESIMIQMEKEMNSFLAEIDIHGNLKWRVKSFESFYEKIQRLEEKSEPLEITDIMAVRIVCPFLEDLEHVVDHIGERFKISEVDKKGKKHSVQEFGYDSIHLLIDLNDYFIPEVFTFKRKCCELQLRTILQDAWAEVEHELIYKSEWRMPTESVRRKLASLNATLTLSDIIFQEIRDFQKEVHQRGIQRRQSIERKVKMDTTFHDHEGTEQISEALGSSHINLNSSLEKKLLQALRAHSNEEYDIAIDTYTEVLSMKPDDKLRSIIYNHRGMAYYVLSEIRASIKDFTKSIKFDEKNIRAWNNKAVALRYLKQYDRALGSFERSLLIKPDNAETLYLRAELFVELFEMEQARKDCLAALDLDNSYAEALELLKKINDDIVS